jgi:hypothetical protein
MVLKEIFVLLRIIRYRDFNVKTGGTYNNRYSLELRDIWVLVQYLSDIWGEELKEIYYF